MPVLSLLVPDHGRTDEEILAIAERVAAEHGVTLLGVKPLERPTTKAEDQAIERDGVALA